MSNNEVKKPDHKSSGILKAIGGVAAIGVAIAGALLGGKKK